MSPDQRDQLDQFAAWMRAGGMSGRTIAERVGFLTRAADLFGHLHLVGADVLAQWFAGRPWSQETRAAYYNHLHAYFVWACGTGRADTNPMLALRRPRAGHGVPRPVTEAQLDDILARAAEPYRTWTLLAAYAGLRCCEIAALRREDVTETQIFVAYGKGGKPAVLPCHPAIWAAVKDRAGGHLAVTPDGQPATAQQVSIRTALYFRRTLGMPGVALHRFRHRFATQLLRRGHNIRVVQELMRHASLNTTARYTAVGEDQRLAAVSDL